MKSKLGGVYAIRNLLTGKVYVGASVDVPRRLTAHVKELDRGKHLVPQLQADWSSIGGEKFSFDLLEVVADKGNLREREQARIEQARQRGETYNASRSTPYGIPRPRRSIPQEDDGRVLTVGEVAERLRVTPEAVRRWLRAGKIRGVRIGSTKAGWRIPESEVRRMLHPEQER